MLTRAGFLPIGDMARRYWRREPVEPIAASHAMSGRTLFRLLERFGIRRNSGTGKDLPRTTQELARSYAHGRRQLQEIAAELGVTRGTVSRQRPQARRRAGLFWSV